MSLLCPIVSALIQGVSGLAQFFTQTLGFVF